MTTINPYLTFNGNCEEAFLFYQSVFGGEFLSIARYQDMPPQGGVSVPPAEANKIMHVSLPISKEGILMGSDSIAALGMTTIVGNNFSISISADSKGDADRLFNALSAGGSANMPMQQAFWGSYFGMLTDQFGINWMVGFDENKNAA